MRMGRPLFNTSPDSVPCLHRRAQVRLSQTPTCLAQAKPSLEGTPLGELPTLARARGTMAAPTQPPSRRGRTPAWRLSLTQAKSPSPATSKMRSFFSPAFLHAAFCWPEQAQGARGSVRRHVGPRHASAGRAAGSAFLSSRLHCLLCSSAEMFEKYESIKDKKLERGKGGENKSKPQHAKCFSGCLPAARRGSQAPRQPTPRCSGCSSAPFSPIPPAVRGAFPPSPAAGVSSHAEVGPGVLRGGRSSPHGGSGRRAGRGVRAPTALAAPHRRSLGPQPPGPVSLPAPPSSPLLPSSAAPSAASPRRPPARAAAAVRRSPEDGAGPSAIAAAGR